MTMQINDLGDGRFELVEVATISHGILTSRRIAERFADFLDQMEEHDRQQLAAFIDENDKQPPDEPAPTLTKEAVLDGAGLGGYGLSMPGIQVAWLRRCAGPAEAIAEALDEPTEPEPLTAEVQTVEDKETPKQEAFRRLEAGETVGAVADDLGLSMPRLRAAWARRCRTAKEEQAAAGSVAGSVECVTCGREFRPGSDGNDTCARCTRELGRA